MGFLFDEYTGRVWDRVGVEIMAAAEQETASKLPVGSEVALPIAAPLIKMSANVDVRPGAAQEGAI